ncbi:MAG TPA: FAD-dependent oxidoreductase [Burkholderiales bacterium]|nr:FAD-dependent oxidoreductase [Burkholderiales bacterium]
MKRIVLLGGGHSHVEVLRRFGLAPAKEVELVLASPHRRTPYSGMLPGLVAGHYSCEETHIDLERVARFAGARFLTTIATGLDPAGRVVTLADGTALEFDLVSLDIGSTPATAGIPGAAAHALGVKPVDAFLRAWDALIERAQAGALKRAVVVGGGAAGLEMVLAMQHRVGMATGRRDAVEWQLLTDVDVLLPAHGPRVRRIFGRILAEREVEVHLSSRVARVERGVVCAANGYRVAGDFILWATGAAAPPRLPGSGLAVDDRGFVAVDETLRSTSHPHVFAAGDCATILGHPRPKSGVYAVRQGPPLAANLRAAAAGRPLARYVPQPRALALISTGDRYAVASRGASALEGAWVWRWKDWIDRRFMRRYARL